MLRTRHRAVVMMVCTIAALASISSMAWADALVQMQYPEFLQPVAVVPTYTSGGAVSGGFGAAIDLAQNGPATNFGGLVVTNGTTPGTDGFAYLAPNGGTGELQSGQQAIFSAISNGGANNPAFTGYIGPTNVGITSSLASQNAANYTVGYFNNADPLTNSGRFYDTWRGVDLTGANATGNGPNPSQAAEGVTLISPTWVGDSELRGEVDLNDYVNWNGGYVFGLTGWQNGDFLYEGSVTLDSYVAWNGINAFHSDEMFPNFGTPVNSSILLPVFPSASVVPEPATLSFLLAGVGAIIAFRFWCRRSAP